MATIVLFATSIGGEDFHVQEEQGYTSFQWRQLRTHAALSWQVQRFRVGKTVGTMIESS